MLGGMEILDEHDEGDFMCLVGEREGDKSSRR